jgi:glycosyltransferase involved in cell wall biosynthesis
MTIGFVINDLGHGGAQKQVALLATALSARMNVRVYVLSTLEAPYARKLRERGIAVTVFPRRSHTDVGRLLALARALSADRIDIVHAFLDAANAYTISGARAHAVRAMMRRVDAVTTNSQAGVALLVNSIGVDRQRVTLVPNATAAVTVARADSASPTIGCVGRLVNLKRVDLIMRALPAVRASVPGAKLEIVGDGPGRPSLQALAHGLKVSDAVTFTGAVEDATVYMARYTCLALASTFEGLPNAALEALAAGIPVVATPVGDVASIVIEGSTGLLVHDPSPQTFANALVRALTDASLQERARADGPRLVRERFSVEAALAALLPLYERLFKQTGAAAVEATAPALGE